MQKQIKIIEKKYTIAAFVSHPIHYVIDLFKKIESDYPIKIEIIFGSDFSIRESVDTTFGKVIKWYSPDILNGLNYKVLKNFSVYKDIGKFFSLANFGLFRVIKKEKYVAIFINGWNYFSNWLAISSSVLHGVPIIMRGESPLMHDLYRSKSRLFIKKIVLSLMFRYVSAFLYIGEENRKFYLKYGVPENKLFFSPYAVNNDMFMGAADKLRFLKQSLRKEIGIGENSSVILFLGKLIEKKRPQDLLRAYEMVLHKKSAGANQDLELMFVGDGPLRDNLERYVREHNLKHVHFVGFKSQAELPKYYTVADIFVLPSESGETWGLVVNEAMCFGLPVIVSDLVGCGHDLVRNGKNGYIFPTGNINELAGEIGKIIWDRSKIQKFGQESLRIVNKYSYDEDAKGMLEAIKYINKN